MHHDADDSSGPAVAVRLTPRDAREAARLLSLLLGHSEEGPAGPHSSESKWEPRRAAKLKDIEDLQGLARMIYVARHSRERFFKKAMFGEPAWDMLVGLYIVDRTGPRTTIGHVTAMAGVPPSSSLRWLQYIEKEGLVIRKPHPTDRRIMFVELTDKARRAIEDYLIHLAELPLG